MAHNQTRMLVNVFETTAHAERAVATLLADGYHAGQIAVIATPPEASGLGAQLSGLGVPTDLAEYYEGEVRAGRALVVVRYHLSDTDDVRATLTRNGGSLHVPPESRESRG